MRVSLQKAGIFIVSPGTPSEIIVPSGIHSEIIVPCGNTSIFKVPCNTPSEITVLSSNSFPPTRPLTESGVERI